MRQWILWGLVVILAFCSMAYELILAQALSAFLSNTVLRYSMTIGLYMFSLGVGSLFAEGRFVGRPVIALQIVEFFLSILGSGSIAVLFAADAAGLPSWSFQVIAHGFILGIGFLSGFELPLFIMLVNHERAESENTVLGFNYFGAFLGAIIFAFLFFPVLGLVPSALTTALLNAFAAVAIGLLYFKEKRECRISKFFGVAGLCALILLCVGLFNAATLSGWFEQIYLGL